MNPHSTGGILTAATYEVFVKLFADLSAEQTPNDALQAAARMMQTLNVRATDYTPENSLQP